jgi:hypothetical protein
MYRQDWVGCRELWKEHYRRWRSSAMKAPIVTQPGPGKNLI